MSNPTVKRSDISEATPLKVYKAFKRKGRQLYTDGMGSTSPMYWKKEEVYSVRGTVELCRNGLHWFRHLCFAIDYLEPNCAICEIEVWGATVEDTEKGVSQYARITKRLNLAEIRKNFIDCARNSGARNSGHWNSGDSNSGHWNSGHWNSGDSNSGARNSGHWNSGDSNSGHWNSGHWNSGDSNSGHWNSGARNSGHRNSGDRNSGHRNSGDRNSGDSNSGDRNSGHRNSGHSNSGDSNSGHSNSGDWNSGNGYRNFFCTETRFFLLDIEIKELPYDLKYLSTSWFNLFNTDGSKRTYQEAWSYCPDRVMAILRNIPEFKTVVAQAKFKQITGRELFQEDSYGEAR